MDAGSVGPGASELQVSHQLPAPNPGEPGAVMCWALGEKVSKYFI